MAASVRQSLKKTYTSGAAETTGALASSTLTGSGFLVCVAFEGGTISSVTDSKSNTYTLLGTTQGGFGGYSGARSAVYWCANGTGGASHTFTVTSNVQTFDTILVAEITGHDTASTPQIAQIIRASSPYTVSLATSNADALLMLFVDKFGSAATQTASESTGFTTVVEETDGASFWGAALMQRSVTSTATYTPSVTITNSSEAMLHLVAIKSASGGTASAAGSAAGSGAATGVGVGIRAATAASAGSSTATGSTSNTVNGTGSATGTGTATGTGASLRAAIGASAPGTQPTLGTHNLTWQREGEGTSPITVAQSVTTGSTVLVVVGGYNTNDATPTDNKGNTFTRVGSRKGYTLWTSWGVSAFVAHNVTGGSDYAVSIAKAGTAVGEASMFAFEIKGGGVVQAYDQQEILAGNALTHSVTPTNAAVLIGTWWGDAYPGPHTADPSSGWTALESALASGSLIQCAAAYKAVSGAGSQTLTWTETPDQGAILELFAIQASNPGGVVVSGIGGAVLSGVGSSAGAGAAAAISAAIRAAAGAAVGAGIATGASNGTGPSPGTGSATGTGTATGVAVAIAAATASAAGTSAVTGGSGGTIVVSAAAIAAGMATVLGRTPIVVAETSTFNYAASAASATRLIQQFGATATLKRQTAGAYNAATGTSTPTETQIQTKAVLVAYPQKFVDGTLILQGDRKGLFVPDVEPKQGDRVAWGGKDWVVVAVTPLSPAGVPVLFEVQLRG